MQEPIDENKINEVSKDRPLSDPTLQQQLNAYKKAVEEEFESRDLANPENHQELVERTRKQLIAAIPTAVTNIVFLAEHADNENVRLKAQMYIIDNGLGETGKFNPVDPIADLVNKLTAPAPPNE